MDPNEDLSDLPELEDLSEELSKLKPMPINESEGDIGDYAKPKPEKAFPQEIIVKPEVQKPQPAFSGLKKGFFSQSSQPKQAPIDEIKPDPQAKNKNKLELPEVQQSMNMNNFLLNDQNKWMTPELLKQISENPILVKLFSNPEYLNAMSLMQKDPKGVIEKYGKNPEFMQIFQEFCKIMGTHFGDIAEKEKAPPKDPQAEKIQKIMDTDKEVQEILKDPQVQSLLQFLTKNQKVELNKILAKDPMLTQKINVLIRKGIINVEHY